MHNNKVNVLGLSRSSLEDFCISINEKPFRARQIMQWIHQHGIANFDEMHNLSKSLKQKLNRVAIIDYPRISHEEKSKDGTRKWLIELDDESQIETVYIPDKGRATLCISSQVGCTLDCSFCHTGKQGYKRNLSASEIIAQVWVANQSFNQEQGATQQRNKRHITNVVMMGMGEPLLNYDAVLEAMKIMKDDLAYGISKRRLTLSTVGVVPKIDQLYKDIDVMLAISLHAPNDELRDLLVPMNKKYPISQLLASCKRFLKHFDENRRRITVEYVMLNKVNDDEKCCLQLINLLSGFPCKINLIPFNPFPHARYKTSSSKRVQLFQEKLNSAGFVVTVRSTRGDDISAACGQLAGMVEDKTKRNERWSNEIANQALSVFKASSCFSLSK